MSSKLIINTLVCAVLSLMIASCGNSVFISEVKEINAPSKPLEPEMEKIASDEIYSQFFAVYDTLLISSYPNSPDYFFYVADLKHNKLIGSFMKKGQGPDEYYVLTPLRRIERKGDDICALTFEPVRKELLEWNISQSIKTGRDSVVSLGFYKEPEEDSPNNYFSALYMIGTNEYIGYLSGNKNIESGELFFPKYWILKGKNPVPEKGLTFVDRFIDNDKSMVPPFSFYASAWTIKPDNSRIVNAMQWLQQINMIDIETGNTSCYRVKGSQGEGIFKTSMENAPIQYDDIVCDNSFIYELYL